jgi:chondroitin AC lyase
LRALSYIGDLNWWWNVIGVPKIAGAACTVVADQLNATQITGCQRITKRPFVSIPQETAANLIDVSLGSVYYGLAGRNASVLSTAFSAGNSALQVTGGQTDGIKVDGSFFQHGGLLASGSYGE